MRSGGFVKLKDSRCGLAQLDHADGSRLNFDTLKQIERHARVM